MNCERMLEKLRKIAALAESGSDGEKQNAREMLARLCEEYGIAPEQLTSEQKHLYKFKYNNNAERDVVSQVVMVVLNVGKIDILPLDKCVVANCTPAQEAEIRTLLSVYIADFRRQREDMLCRLKSLPKSFIYVNNIFRQKDDADDKKAKPLSPEEIRILLETCSMLKPSIVRRQLSD